jgi:hypothetical protein
VRRLSSRRRVPRALPSSPPLAGRPALAELEWLARGVPPARIGWGAGPLTAARAVRHRARRGRRLRICLLELPHPGPPIGAAHAFWINARSRACEAVRNGRPERADVVWLLSQDPLTPAARERLEALVRGLPPHVAVINHPAAYDAYHATEAFPRLEAAGVRVPRTAFGPDDEGITPVVYKAQYEQPARKFLAPWRGPVAGFRAFAYEDARDAEGRAWRHRAYHLLGEVLAGDAVGSAAWEARAETRVAVDLQVEVRAEERAQIVSLAETLGLDFFAVDFVRRGSDGAAVFLDVNVFPVVLIAEGVVRARGLRGGWHVWEVADRFGRPDAGRPHWRRFDDAVTALVERTRAAADG